MERLSDLLRALEDQGASLDHQTHAMVWLIGPDLGCYVRTASIIRIETYWRPNGETWSKVYLHHGDGMLETVVDTRRPKTVQRAVRKVERLAAMSLLQTVLDRVRR